MILPALYGIRLRRSRIAEEFIEVVKGGRCSFMQPCNPYSTVVLEEKMKHA